MLMPALLGGAAGAVVGSYWATLVLRWPDGRATGGRSACDRCGARLRWFELLPLLSALVQRGACRRCRAPIDATHQQIEAACAAIGAIALMLSPDTTGAALALLGLLLVPLMWLDGRHHWLPDRLVALVAVSGLVVGGALGASLADRVAGMVAGYASLALIRWGYRRWRGREGMGGGDPKLLGAIGAWLGWAALPGVLLIAALIGLALALGRGLGRDKALPFGLYLAVAALIVAVWPFLPSR